MNEYAENFKQLIVEIANGAQTELFLKEVLRMLYLVVELQESASQLSGEFSVRLRGVYYEESQAQLRMQRLEQREGGEDYCGHSHFFQIIPVEGFGPMDILLVEDGWECRSYVRSLL